MSNDEVFAAAYREHYWAVSRYVARRLQGRADEVEEVVAEVFTVAWRRRADLPAAPLPWLYGVARNCLANAVRGYGRRRRLVDRLGNDEAAHGRHIAVGPDAEAPGAWVHEALDRLSPADQEVLRLAAWEELGAEEIAVALGCGRRAAAMRLHRARRRLRTEIEHLRPTTRPPDAPAAPPADISPERRARPAPPLTDGPLEHRPWSGPQRADAPLDQDPRPGPQPPAAPPGPCVRPAPGSTEGPSEHGLRLGPQSVDASLDQCVRPAPGLIEGPSEHRLRSGPQPADASLHQGLRPGPQPAAPPSGQRPRPVRPPADVPGEHRPRAAAPASADTAAPVRRWAVPGPAQACADATVAGRRTAGPVRSAAPVPAGDTAPGCSPAGPAPSVAPADAGAVPSSPVPTVDACLCEDPRHA